MVDSPIRVPDGGAQNSEQSTAPNNQDYVVHGIPIKGAPAMITHRDGRLYQDHHQNQPADHGTSSSAPTYKEEKTGEEGEEMEGAGRNEKMVEDEESKDGKEPVRVKEGEGKERGEGGGKHSSDQHPSQTLSDSATTQPGSPTARERRASDAVRVYWDLIDGEFVAIPPDSSDLRGALTGEKQRKMDEELRKIYEERGWAARD
ncbi:MAG: hypothetical protein OHK93_007889 [Ramalina farinacea]|uniref:Uncharacterized protein n=1 Tax=Ramalina farinacea TaxID=258253 RepID=A0AA43QNI1_9LECA|nr:hypothetical protein [Ramalina farinacea]